MDRGSPLDCLGSLPCVWFRQFIRAVAPGGRRRGTEYLDNTKPIVTVYCGVPPSFQAVSLPLWDVWVPHYPITAASCRTR